MPGRIFYSYKLDESFYHVGVNLFCNLDRHYCTIYANSVVPDQTPHNAASDLGLHCLPIFCLIFFFSFILFHFWMQGIDGLTSVVGGITLTLIYVI